MSIPAVNMAVAPTGVSVASIPIVSTAVKAYAANVLNTLCTFIHHSTRGTTAYLGFALQGIKGQGVVFAPAAQFNGKVPATLQFSVFPVGAVIPQGSTLLTRRGTVTCPKDARQAYGAIGCPGIVFHVRLLPVPLPDALVVNVVLSATPRAATTAAVVAAANVAIATATATPVLAPPAVAAVAAVAADKLVTASRPASAGKTGAERKLHGKH